MAQSGGEGYEREAVEEIMPGPCKLNESSKNSCLECLDGRYKIGSDEDTNYFCHSFYACKTLLGQLINCNCNHDKYEPGMRLDEYCNRDKCNEFFEARGYNDFCQSWG